MLSIHRFLYGAIIGSLIVWTIYLLTIDFYSISFISYQYKHTIYVPFMGSWINLYSLATLNLVTLFAVSCFTLVKHLKNTQVISPSLYQVEGSKDEIKI